ncbi:hypothetical protein [Intrasporangium sp. DVR]|uniref:hypothetical protein n=1 Tax=Intrasporangium sp. DVR TaxID=3127867 RepID=UPI00313A65D4
MTTSRGARTPRELLATFVAQVAARDVAGIAGSYAADAVVSLPHGREATGSAAIRAAYAAALAAGARLAVDARADESADESMVGAVVQAVVDGARVIETGPLSMVSFTGVDGGVRTLLAWRGESGWAWVRDGSMLRDVEAALGTGLSDVA